MTLSGPVDSKDPKIHPTLAFTTQDTEVTAVVGVGEDAREGSTVVVTWYRLAGSKRREALFSHEIAVGSAGQAFSQAVAPKGFAPGIYDTEATAGGHVTHTPFVVREAGGGQTGAAAQAATGDEDWNVPDSGDSWWSDGSEQPPQSAAPSETCTFQRINGGMSPIADVQATAWWLGPCTKGALTAAVSGLPATLASSDALAGPIPHLYGSTWICALEGGSDMPGTVVHFDASGNAGGSADFVLPDDGRALIAAILGTPEAGSKVAPGERIEIDALAMVMPPALGVKTLAVDDRRTVLRSVGNRSGNSEPQECDPRRFYAALHTSYQIPAGAPPVIELCATGVGFDGTKSKDCVRYYTGEVWEARIHLQTDQRVNPYTCQQTGDARGELLVAADGRISAALNAVEKETCTFGFDRTRSGLTLVLEGTASASALTVNHTGNTADSTTTGYFLLGFFSAPGVLDPVPVPITAPGVAKGSVTRAMPNDYTITLTFDFRCVTCE